MQTKLRAQNLFLIFFLFACFNSFAQKKWDTKEQKYFDAVVLVGVVDASTEKVLGLVPKGKNVKLVYDTFFDRYTAEWIEVNGPAKMILAFSEENSNGRMYVDTFASNTQYYVENYIESDNKLVVMAVKPTYIENVKVKVFFVFDDLK